MNKNKTEMIGVRVTNEEKELIFSKADSFGMKVSDYLRFVGIHTKELKQEKEAVNES